MTWIRDRGISYYITERTPTLTYGIMGGISVSFAFRIGKMIPFSDHAIQFFPVRDNDCSHAENPAERR